MKTENSISWRFYELLFTFNITTVLMVGIANTMLPDRILPLLRWKLSLNQYLHLHPHSNVGGMIAFWGSDIILAICGFGILLISGTAAPRKILYWTAGITGFMSVPLCWLWIAVANDVHAPFWLLAEMAVAAGWVIIYVAREDWSLRLPLAMLIAHFGFWFWFISHTYAFTSLLPLGIGMLVSGVWILQMTTQRKATIVEGGPSGWPVHS